MSTPVTALVSVSRERFLRQNEIKIRNAASNALDAAAIPDPLLHNAFVALRYCDDFHDRHSIAVTANRAAMRNSAADEHERYAAKAIQLRLRTLDQLCHLVGF